MELRVDGAEAAAVHVRVVLRRLDGGVAEQFLDRPQVGAAGQDVRREAVPQRVRADRRGQPGAGAQAYHAWIHKSIAEAVPLDRFARELITASGDTASAPAANYYQAVSEPTNWMETTAQLFMGRRVQCAKCHNHPFDRITQDNYYALAAFFAQVKVRDDSRGFGGRRRRQRQAPMLTVALEPSAQMVQPRTGEVMEIPEGIDPGFDYNPGADRSGGLQGELDARKARLKVP